jgi:hypothetical protein
MIESLPYKDNDLQYLATKASIEHCKLSQLEHRLVLNNQDVRRQKMIKDIMENAQISLSRLSKNLNYHKGSSNKGGQHVKPGNKLTRAFTWLASDQQTIEKMLSRLKELNTDLEVLLSAPQLSSLKFGLVPIRLPARMLRNFGGPRVPSEKNAQPFLLPRMSKPPELKT